MASPDVRGITAPVAGLIGASPSSTQIGDIVKVITWERTGAGVPTHTLQSTFVEILSHSHDDGSTDGRLSVAYKIATASGVQNYQAYTSSAGTDVWTGIIVYDKDLTAVDDIRSASQTLTTNVPPNPPSVNVDPKRDWITTAIGAWHLSASATVAVTHVVGYQAQWDIAGAALGELAASTQMRVGVPTSSDPGGFADDVIPNGTASMTIALPNKQPSDGIWQRVVAAGGLTVAGTSLVLNVVDTIDVGQLLIITGGGGSSSISSIIDSKGNTYTVDIAGTGATAARSSICSCKVGTQLVSGDTITVTFAASATVAAVCHQFAPPSGKAWAASPFDKSAGTSGSSNTPSSGATATLAQADELCIGAFGYNATSNRGIKPDSGWTPLSGAMETAAGRRTSPCYKIVAATTAVTASGVFDNAASAAWSASVATYKLVAAAQTVAVGTAAETDSALVVGRRKSKLLGIAPETDSALVISRAAVGITAAVGIAAEVDSAPAFGRQKSKLLGPALETDSARAVHFPVKLGIALETDAALALVRRHARLLGIAPEVDSALSLGRVSIRTLGPALETDSALAFVRRHVRALGIATEFDSALTIVRSGIAALAVIASQYDREVVSMSGDVKLIFGTYTFSASYATGGESFVLPPSVQKVISVIVAPAGGYVLVYAPATKKLKAYRSSGVAGPLTEVPAATDLSVLGALDFAAVTY